MPTDVYLLPELGVEVALATGAARTPTVEVSYEGTLPPLALLSHLGALGVEGLVPQPPPAHAIEWPTDARPDASPTILPFEARASGTIQVPAGERERALDAVRYLLQRAATSPGTSRSGASAASSPGDDVVLEVVSDVADADAVRHTLDLHGALLGEEATTTTSQIVYRGQRTATHHPAVRFRVSVSAPEEAVLLDALSRRRLRTVDRIG